MSPEHKSVARAKLEKARAALRDAQVAATHGGNLNAINRCYYACFYAISALLFTDDKWSKKHKGVQSLFNNEYIRTGILSLSSGDTYNQLFERRLYCDYYDFASVEDEEVTQWIVRTEALIDEVAEIVFNRTPPPLADPEDLKE